jgi:hypothetical protein
VDHPLSAPTSDALIRPWRIAAFVAVSVAALELVVLVVIGGNSLLHSVSHRVQHAATQHALGPTVARTPAVRHHKPPPAAKLSRSHVHVLVLNGNGRTGAAAAAAARVRRHGYKIGGVGNARKLVGRSLVMYRPGFAGEGRRLGRDLGVKIVGPLDGMRKGDLHGAQVVFILGP